MSAENIVINWASFSSLLLPSTQVDDFSLLMLWQVVYTFLKHSAMSNYVSGKQSGTFGFPDLGLWKKAFWIEYVFFRWSCELLVKGTEMEGGFGMRWGVMWCTVYWCRSQAIEGSRCCCYTFVRHLGKMGPPSSLLFLTAHTNKKGLTTFEDIKKKSYIMRNFTFNITAYKVFNNKDFMFLICFDFYLSAFSHVSATK